MKCRNRMTVTLQPEEVRDAICEYIASRAVADAGKPNGSTIIYLVTEDHGRHADCCVEADWFENS